MERRRAMVSEGEQSPQAAQGDEGVVCRVGAVVEEPGEEVDVRA